ncbi:hypothetical protein FAES_5139 [Fibrella aestuarina BUZ 2]|uniref:Uncharacterized protein n=1 Tax=Fibrella aestuarina BUZ 2 TaxID=1166018 RepID=I0KG85_9BACT|nr:hypothetical protein FAES_5139 [Fibrella aestuarina BUZ 2]
MVIIRLLVNLFSYEPALGTLSGTLPGVWPGKVR